MEQQPLDVLSYEPLKDNEIRLLRVQPGVSDSISIQLSNVNLDAQPAFWALSYVWGPIEDPAIVTINGIPFSVTRNLYHALIEYRRQFSKQDATTTSFLWVDAICLNQNDHLEKSVQVPRMSLIYGRCERVLAWLGPVEDDDMADVCQLADKLKLFVAPADPSHQSMTEGDRITSFRKSAYSDPQAAAEVESVRRALRSLGRRPWFRRVWILQEAVLAQRQPMLLCGPFELGYEIFFNTWVPHDRIYAILGLLSCDPLPHALTPDYTKPFERLCHELVIFILEETQDIRVLNLGTLGNISGVTSWTPDLRNSWMARVNLVACPGKCFHVSEDGQTLTMPTIVLGRCVSVYGPAQPDSETGLIPPSIFMELDESIIKVAAAIKRLTRMEVMNEWFRYHLANIYTEERLDRDPSILQRVMMAYVCMVHNQPIESLGTRFGNREQLEGADGMVRNSTFQQRLVGHSTFVLQDGTVGEIVGTETTACAGDALCVFPGIPIPLLIRPEGDGDYRVVGQVSLWKHIGAQLVASLLIAEVVLAGQRPLLGASARMDISLHSKADLTDGRAGNAEAARGAKSSIDDPDGRAAASLGQVLGRQVRDIWEEDCLARL
ncbi:hypothetical protein FGRMN_431 [Fusarium graminum]|nr:hypothetical protein FGRMN_431 [Fusarium graminum]